jgi:hypothetical protein
MDLFCLEIDSRIEAPCVNSDADQISSVNYEIGLNWRIFFFFRPRLFSRSEDSVCK